MDNNQQLQDLENILRDKIMEVSFNRSHFIKTDKKLYVEISNLRKRIKDLKTQPK